MKTIQNKRIDYLDIAKGLLIISVVLCHSSFPNAHLLYWFHMPAFFIISGILHKRGLSIKEQALKFFIPYIAFSIFDIIINIGLTNINLNNFSDQAIRYTYGGKATWGVFWFIPCIFLTKILFDKLLKHLKPRYVVLLMVFSYILAHIYSMNVIPNTIPEVTEQYFVPWNLDVLFITIPFYALGYYIKDITNIFKSKILFIISGITVVYFLLGSNFGFVSYYLNFKYSYYKYPILDLVIPLSFTIFILCSSYWLNKLKFSKILTVIGSSSLVIMYLHKPIAGMFDSIFNHNFIIYTIIGVVLPLVISKIIDLSTISKFIFKGDLSLYKKYKCGKTKSNEQVLSSVSK